MMAQTQADSRLQARFSTTTITNLTSQEAEIIEFWNYFLDNGFYVADIGSKTADLTDFYSIPAKDPATGTAFDVSSEDPAETGFNVLKFDFSLDENAYTFYKLNSTQAIVFYPKSLLTQMYNDAQ